jgi:endonuclease-3 related protein
MVGRSDGADALPEPCNAGRGLAIARSSEDRLVLLVGLLEERFGDIPWWPGSCEEVMIGAVLTQQTRWRNVEVALMRLKERNLCSISGIYQAPSAVIEEAVRCTGFFRIKTARLKALAEFVVEGCGGPDLMKGRSTGDLRAGLLGVRGIGAETADSILCYALDRPSFVIDAYTERICGCAGIPERKGALKTLFERILPEDNRIYRKVHAHFVEYAKEFCGTGKCEVCRIRNVHG